MVQARFFIEFLGNYPENLKKRIETIEKQIRESLDVVESYIGEPEKMDEKLYSSFLEITIRFDNLEDLFGFILDFTPTAVEVLEPESITLKMNELQNLLNDFASKVRVVAWAAKELWAENKILKERINYLKNLLKKSANSGERDVGEK